MVITSPDQVALTPVGKPFPPETPLLAIPVAPVVAWVIFVKAVLIHNVGAVDPAAAVLVAVTVTVTLAVVAFPQEPDVTFLLKSCVPAAKAAVV